MRVGATKRIEADDYDDRRGEFDFGRLVQRSQDTVHVGLVGGSDPASLAVRRAQGFLRFDRRPSYFSTVFLFTGNEDSILEARVIGADPARPETGGVVEGSASRYRSRRAYPNAAVVSVTFQKVKGGIPPAQRVAKVLDAARDVKAIRARYDLWQMIAQWQMYLFEPERTPNPLAGGAPHPGAAFVRWALGMAGVEGAPGAMDEFDAPEHFWAAANYWYEQYAQPSVAVDISLARCITDPAGKVALPGK